jgi:hypothetical protein
LYIEATEFLHFGGMAFSGIMAEIDRRGSAITHVNEDCRWGFGPFHKWHRDEVYGPADRYKSGEMPTWEERMAAKSYETHAFSDLLHVKEQSIPAKRMRFEGDALGRYPRGWQDWGFIGVDLALSEPFLIHAGFRLRVGVDVSQVTDLLVGLFGLDLYGDDPTETEYEGLYDHSPEGR